jgi:hypothetical protein
MENTMIPLVFKHYYSAGYLLKVDFIEVALVMTTRSGKVITRKLRFESDETKANKMIQAMRQTRITSITDVYRAWGSIV